METPATHILRTALILAWLSTSLECMEKKPPIRMCGSTPVSEAEISHGSKDSIAVEVSRNRRARQPWMLGWTGH